MMQKGTEERNEIFDSAVRNQLAGHEPAVPHALWNRIASELDGTTTPAQAPANNTKRQPYQKYAAAAAVFLTLGAGTLLYTMKQAPVANKPVVATAKPAVIPSNTSGADKSVLAVASPVSTAAKAPEKPTIVKADVIKKRPALLANQENLKVKNTVFDQSATGSDKLKVQAPVPAEQAPVANNANPEPVKETTNPGNPVEVGNIPLAALNFLNRSLPVNNDEITIIKSADKKKKHARRQDEESTKVIMLGKKFDSRPDIKYQVPVRF